MVEAGREEGNTFPIVLKGTYYALWRLGWKSIFQCENTVQHHACFLVVICLRRGKERIELPLRIGKLWLLGTHTEAVCMIQKLFSLHKETATTAASLSLLHVDELTPTIRAYASVDELRRKAICAGSSIGASNRCIGRHWRVTQDTHASKLSEMLKNPLLLPKA